MWNCMGNIEHSVNTWNSFTHLRGEAESPGPFAYCQFTGSLAPNMKVVIIMIIISLDTEDMH